MSIRHGALNIVKWREEIYKLEREQKNLRIDVRHASGPGHKRCEHCGHARLHVLPGRNMTADEGKQQHRRRLRLTCLYTLRALLRGRAHSKHFWKDERNLITLMLIYQEFVFEPLSKGPGIKEIVQQTLEMAQKIKNEIA